MAKPFNKIKFTGWLGLDDQLTFGRHIGYTVLEVLKDHPEYIGWLINNTSIKFRPSVQSELFKQIAGKEIYSYAVAYRKSRNYMPDYDHDTLSDWADWDADVPF